MCLRPLLRTSSMVDKTNLHRHRLTAQGLNSPARNRDEYLDLFRRLQPVAPVAFTRPGDPPRLVHRTTFDDGALADEMRGERELVKGRFLGSNIGYVLAADLRTYATAFRKPVIRMTPIQERILQALRYAGELSMRQLGEETGLKNKEIAPALHRLQQAFLVFEDQEDSSWARPWSLMEHAWPDLDLDALAREEATLEVIGRFLEGHVGATFEQLRDWSRLATRLLQQVLALGESAGALVTVETSGSSRIWMLPESQPATPAPTGPTVFMLHRSDPLVLAEQGALKQQYAGREVLQYLLVDGEFRGAVCGHWRIGPHDVDDIVLDLPASQCRTRKEAILAAAAEYYHPPKHHILRYTGKDI